MSSHAIVDSVSNDMNNNNNNDSNNKRKKPIDDSIDFSNNNNNNTTNTTIITSNSNKKSKTELQSVVDIAGEILSSLLPENKSKELPDPPMRRLNLVQQIFERNNKLIDGIYIHIIVIMFNEYNNFTL